MSELPRLSYASSEGDRINFETEDGKQGVITEAGAFIDEDAKPVVEITDDEPPMRDAGYTAERDDWNRSAVDVYGKRGQVSKEKK